MRRILEYGRYQRSAPVPASRRRGSGDTRGPLFDADETVLITDVVLVETVWTLAGRKYRLDKAEPVAVLGRLFSEPNIRFEDDQVVWRALQAYRGSASAGEALSGQGAGFADALIVFKAMQVASNSGDGLKAVYTFDSAMRGLPATAAP